MIFLGKLNVLGNVIAACDYEYLLSKISKAISNRKTIYISPTTSHILALSYIDRGLRDALNKCDYIVPDSQWVRRSLRFLHGVPLKKRVYGPELVQKTLKLANKMGLKIFMCGATANSSDIFLSFVKTTYPKINLVGAIPRKEIKLTKKYKKTLILKLKKSRPDILLVGLGSNLQDKFVFNLLYKNPRLDKPIVVITAGAAFDFLTNVKPQAPKWMMELGFEWAFRLFHEPRRLWKRYLLFGPFFLILVLRQKVMQIMHLTYFRKNS
jgi:exopolysaccharide biosynthesis WecB/TagA/CpsF family protein